MTSPEDETVVTTAGELATKLAAYVTQEPGGLQFDLNGLAGDLVLLAKLNGSSRVDFVLAMCAVWDGIEIEILRKGLN